MKLSLFTIAISLFFISCNNDNSSNETSRVTSTLKSDILLENSAIKPFSRENKKDFVYLTLSGETILESTATFKALSDDGEELHCESFPVDMLIQSEYKTANSTLKEAHVREVVEGYFVDELNFQNITDDTLAGL